uniref:Uncharacterized protein n=1 Tax=Moniliophthora roreri TaxID=221103 RepID=A0A0W0F7C9_MONRR
MSNQYYSVLSVLSIFSDRTQDLPVSSNLSFSQSIPTGLFGGDCRTCFMASGSWRGHIEESKRLKSRGGGFVVIGSLWCTFNALDTYHL